MHYDVVVMLDNRKPSWALSNMMAMLYISKGRHPVTRGSMSYSPPGSKHSSKMLIIMSAARMKFLTLLIWWM